MSLYRCVSRNAQVDSLGTHSSHDVRYHGGIYIHNTRNLTWVSLDHRLLFAYGYNDVYPTPVDKLTILVDVTWIESAGGAIKTTGGICSRISITETCDWSDDVIHARQDFNVVNSKMENKPMYRIMNRSGKFIHVLKMSSL